MKLPRAAALMTTLAVTALALVTIIAPRLPAQQPGTITRLVAVPAKVAMQAGDSVPFRVTAYDAQGNVVADAPVRVGGPRRSLGFGDG